jgi:fibronectin type 3 domain-containing protein
MYPPHGWRSYLDKCATNNNQQNEQYKNDTCSSPQTITCTTCTHVYPSFRLSVEEYTPVLSSQTIPQNLVATAGNTQVSLNWNAVAGATGYNIKRSTTAGGPYSAIATGVSGTLYADTTVTNGTTYYYIVTALSGTGESGNSNQASATPTTPTTTPPNGSSNGAVLRIHLVSGLYKEYDVSMAEVNSFISWYNGRDAGTGLEFYVFNRPSAQDTLTTYKEYIVFSKIEEFEVTENGASTPVQVTAPANLIASGGISKVALAWNTSPNAAAYNVKRSLTEGGPFSTIASNVYGTSYNDTNVTNGITYYYVVTAMLNSTESENSNKGSATPIVAPVTVPTNLAASGGISQVVLNWNGIVEAGASYNVKRSLVDGGPYSKIASNVNGTSYTDTSVTNGTAYHYVVTAIVNGVESTNSNQAVATSQAPIVLPAAILDLNTGIPYSNDSMKLDGQDDYSTLSETGIVPQGGSNYTVEVWFKKDTFNTGLKEILSQWRSVNMSNGSSGSFYLGMENGNIRFSDSWPSIAVGALMPDMWYHLAAVSTPDNAYIYINGELKATKGSPLIYTGTGPLILGRQGELIGEYFDGSVSDIRIWNVARTQEQIQSTKDKVLSGSEAGLVRYWRLSPLTLKWTAPAAGSIAGTSHYDIRYSTSVITESNWSSAIQVTGEPLREAVGASQTMVINGLTENTTYYFAIKTFDAEGNISGLSNVPSSIF